MSLIQFELIEIPSERMRRDFDEEKLKTLEDSIVRLGLINPITLGDDEKTLVAGERRLRAVKNASAKGREIPGIPAGHITYTTLSQLSTLQRLEAELEENVVRTDLSWQEQTMAVAKLHELRTGTESAWTITKTASEILGKPAKGEQIRDVSEDIALAKYMDNPLVSSAPTKKEALRAIKEKQAREERAIRTKHFDAAGTQHILTCADVFTLSPETLPKVDCFVLDPPYGIDISKHAFALEHDYDDSQDTFSSIILNNLPALTAAVAKPQSHLYCFCDIRKFDELFTAFAIRGWQVWPRPFIWDKGHIGTFGADKYGPRHVYDAVLYANRGNKSCTALYQDVIRIPQKQGGDHPAEKPVEVYLDLLKRSVLPGDTIADFFGGSGPIIGAANELKCTAIYVESDRKYFDLAVDRYMIKKGKEK